MNPVILPPSELMNALLEASRKTREAYEAAKRAGRDDVADECRAAGFRIGAAIGALGRGQRSTAS